MGVICIKKSYDLGIKCGDIMIPNLFESCPVHSIRNVSLFHGTSRKNIANIVSDGFNPSSNSDHYLGSGVYFFDSENFAIWWMFNEDKCLKIPIQKILDEIELIDDELTEIVTIFQTQNGVISSKITDINYLDMDNFKVKEMFNEIYEYLYNSCNTENIFDTTIYEFLFEKMNFREKFDMVVLTTNLYKLTDKKGFRNKAPQALIPYRIYCIKNMEKIENISEHVISEEHMDTCIRFMALKERPR